MEEMIRTLQRRFDQAELRGDTAQLGQLIADDFVSIGPRGFLLDRAGWIGRHEHFSYQALDTSEMAIRLYGQAAVVRNIQRNRATYAGEEVALTVRVGQVWVQGAAGWQIVAIQFSPMPEE